jgi:hypothetical protein
MRRLQFTSVGARAAVATRAGSWILPFVNLVSAGSHGPVGDIRSESLSVHDSSVAFTEPDETTRFRRGEPDYSAAPAALSPAALRLLSSPCLSKPKPSRCRNQRRAPQTSHGNSSLVKTVGSVPTTKIKENAQSFYQSRFTPCAVTRAISRKPQSLKLSRSERTATGHASERPDPAEPTLHRPGSPSFQRIRVMVARAIFARWRYQ